MLAHSVHARKQRFQVRDVLGLDQIFVKPGSEAFASHPFALVSGECDQDQMLVRPSAQSAREFDARHVTQ